MKNTNKHITVFGQDVNLSLNDPVWRFNENPILTAHDVNQVWNDPAHQVITVHNAGITEFHDQMVMLFRSHFRNGLSVIGLATNKNGISNWKISPAPVLKPCTINDEFAAGTNPEQLIVDEAGGVEDARISRIDNTYFITYSAYHGFEKDRVRVSLASTKNFKDFVRHGPVLQQDMRNVVLFPEKINNRYWALMRPNDNPDGSHTGGIFKEIRIAETDDISSNQWTVHDEPIMKQAGGPSSFGDKIGPGAPPIKTWHGWLNIFHGVRTTMDGNPYILGVALHNLHNPTEVSVSNIPILFPTAADCKTQPEEYVHVPNVVFTCGASRKPDGTIVIYYGGNDTVMNVAFSHEDILAELCKRFPQDPLTGVPQFSY